MNQKQEEPQYPFYIKAPLILIGLVLIFYILYILKSILIPVAFAILIAILLNPLNVRLEKRMPKVLAIIVSILIATLVIAGLLYFLSTQIAGFVDSIPLLQKKITILT